MYIMFIDESGDHNLIKINKDYPVFVLAGCIVKSSYYNPNFIKAVNVYKRKLFNTKRIILHTADLCATPVGRKYIGKRTHEDYKIIKSKFRKRNNEIYGYGLIMIPEE